MRILSLSTMYYYTTTLALAALISSVHSHGVIIGAVGDSGESQGFLGEHNRTELCCPVPDKTFQSTRLLPVTAQPSALANRIQPSFVTPRLPRTLSTHVVEPRSMATLMLESRPRPNSQPAVLQLSLKVHSWQSPSIRQAFSLSDYIQMLTMWKVNADGAGPYECDLDETSEHICVRL